MIIVYTKHVVNDERDFCFSWRAIPTAKYHSSILKIQEYAFPDSEVPDEFYKKHAIYYVDHEDKNRLVKAYEYEEQWDNMQFVDTGDLVGVGGDLTEDSLLTWLIKNINEINIRVTNIENLLESLDIDKIREDLDMLLKEAIMRADIVDIRQLEDR